MINVEHTMNSQNKTKVMVRFPNESFHEEVLIDLKDFSPERSFDDETFGWYNGTYISIKK